MLRVFFSMHFLEIKERKIVSQEALAKGGCTERRKKSTEVGGRVFMFNVAIMNNTNNFSC